MGKGGVTRIGVCRDFIPCQGGYARPPAQCSLNASLLQSCLGCPAPERTHAGKDPRGAGQGEAPTRSARDRWAGQLRWERADGAAGAGAGGSHAARPRPRPWRWPLVRSRGAGSRVYCGPAGIRSIRKSYFTQHPAVLETVGRAEPGNEMMWRPRGPRVWLTSAANDASWREIPPRALRVPSRGRGPASSSGSQVVG